MIANGGIRQVLQPTSDLINILPRIIFNTTRARILGKLFMILSLIICLRLIYLNIMEKKFLALQLNSRISRTINLASLRGNIIDRNGNYLAVSTQVDSLWANPSMMEHLNYSQLNQLAFLLDLSLADLNQKLQDKNKTFVYLKRAISPQQALKVKNLGIEGIFSLVEFKRYYPEGEMLSHIVGYTNIDDNGAAGIEYIANNNLKGRNGNEQIVRDPQGHVIEEITQNNARNGNYIKLSIDDRIQYLAYKALKDTVEKFNAKGGSVVVMDAKTGEILALANSPSFNPNNRNNINSEQLRNRALANVFDPGSIIKPLVIAKALDDKLVNPQTVFDTHPYRVGPKKIVDDHFYPRMTVTEIVAHSSDIGTSKIGLKYKPHILWQYYKSIGFGSQISGGFPGETNGILLDWKKWHPIDQALMSYGYGIAVSVLQMARAYTVFTNNGCVLDLTFYKSNTNKFNCTSIINSDTAKTMREILATAVIDGTGKSSALINYTSAGKTGTAQKLIAGRYSNHAHIASFIGFAPATNPKIIVAISIDEPTKNGYHGAQVAAPVFVLVAEPSLKLLGIKPDKGGHV